MSTNTDTDTAQPEAAGPAARDDRAGAREWLGLAVLALPTLLVSIDVFVMLLALPRIATSVGASGVEQLWIMDAYGFMLSGFLITMGALGDRVGRRKLLLTGAVAFALISMVAAYSVNPIMLIICRGALGVAGATLAPSTLSLISTMFRNASQRGLAIGIWFACFMGGAVLGPVVGGTMLSHFWWGSVLLLGAPAMILLLIFGPITLPEYRAPGARRLDPISVAVSLAAILPFVFGLKEMATGGLSWTSIIAFVFGALAGVAFVRRQLRLEDPLLDVRLFRDRRLSTALGVMFTGTMLTGALMLFITEYLQQVKGLSPLDAAFWMLPVVSVSLITVLVAPVLARRIRPAYLIAGGLLVSVAGLLIIVSARSGSSPSLIVTGWAVMNIGAGPYVALITNIVIGTAPPERAGSAAALNETAGEFGYALGIAALGSVGAAVYRSGIGPHLTGVPADQAASARDSLAGALTVAGSLPGAAGDALVDAARSAFVNGMSAAATISAAVLAGLAVLVVIVLRRVPPTSATSEPPTSATSEPPAQAPQPPAHAPQPQAPVARRTSVPENLPFDDFIA